MWFIAYKSILLQEKLYPSLNALQNSFTLQNKKLLYIIYKKKLNKSCVQISATLSMQLL